MTNPDAYMVETTHASVDNAHLRPAPEISTAAGIKTGKAVALVVCPYCKSRLSSVEAKMERCLSCGAQLDSSRSSASADSDEFTVRI